MSSSINIVKNNDVEHTKLQEVRSVRQQEVKSTTNYSEYTIITENIVGTKIYQYVICQSKSKRHSPT